MMVWWLNSNSEVLGALTHCFVPWFTLYVPGPGVKSLGVGCFKPMLNDGVDGCIKSSTGTSYDPGPGVEPLIQSKKVGVDF